MNFFIFGSGPAGLGLAKGLIKKYQKLANVIVLEKRVLSGGLLRTGVAPDHTEIRDIL